MKHNRYISTRTVLTRLIHAFRKARRLRASNATSIDHSSQRPLRRLGKLQSYVRHLVEGSAEGSRPNCGGDAITPPTKEYAPAPVELQHASIKRPLPEMPPHLQELLLTAMECLRLWRERWRLARSSSLSTLNFSEAVMPSRRAHPPPPPPGDKGEEGTPPPGEKVLHEP
jgi:hypothetical protein